MNKAAATVPAVLKRASSEITAVTDESSDSIPTPFASLYLRLQLASVRTFLEISAGLERLPPDQVETVKDLQLEFARKLDDEKRKQEIAEAITKLLFVPGAGAR